MKIKEFKINTKNTELIDLGRELNIIFEVLDDSQAKEILSAVEIIKIINFLHKCIQITNR